MENNRSNVNPQPASEPQAVPSQPAVTPTQSASAVPPYTAPVQPNYAGAPPQYAPPVNYASAPPQYAPPVNYANVPQPYTAPAQPNYAGMPPQYTAPAQPNYGNVPPQYIPPAQPSTGTGGPQYEKIDKRILNACRHKSELRWYWGLVILNILIIIFSVGYFISSAEENQKYVDDVTSAFSEVMETTADGEDPQKTDTQTADGDESKDSMDKLEDEIDKLPENMEWLLMIVFLLIAIPFVVSYAYAQYRSMSVQITEKTYPEIYAIVQEFSQKLGFKRVPKVYIVQGNGVLNAFSAFIPFKQYIELYADLVEVAYREHHDMDTLRFIIGHEMGHIYYKHATMHYYYSMLLTQGLPILGSTASRAREYSCDRLAQLLSGSDGIDAMMALTTGIHLYKQVDKQDYIDHTREIRGLFVFCFNLVCDHPVTSKRVIALADPMRRSGKLY